MKVFNPLQRMLPDYLSHDRERTLFVSEIQLLSVTYLTSCLVKESGCSGNMESNSAISDLFMRKPFV